MKRMLLILIGMATLLGAIYWFRLGQVSFLGEIPAQARSSEYVAPGWGESLAAELKKIGQISKDDFRTRYEPKTPYLKNLDWDPTTAMFFDRFDLDPNVPGIKVRARGAEEKMLLDAAMKMGKNLHAGDPVYVEIHSNFDFRLNPEERQKFKTNGFVVSERLGARSCTDMYYRIYKRDLPVLITSDAILHAWHRSYDAILEDTEVRVLAPTLAKLLAGMSDQVAAARSEYGDGLFRDSLLDVDYYLAVARSLLQGTAVSSVLQQDERVRRTLNACQSYQADFHFDLFGKNRQMDFSQFLPRGHYEKSVDLKNYFHAMMWCGRIDLRVAGNPNESSPRELASAVVMNDLLERSKGFELWNQFDGMLQVFVGKPDSMTFAQLNEVLRMTGLRSPKDFTSANQIDVLRKQIEAGDFGAQEIRGDLFLSDRERPGKLVLPRSFTLLGQKFVVDSWALSNLVYDDIVWNNERIQRRVPSCIDVSFSVFGNDHAVPILMDRLINNGRKFRDGLNYQHNLAAVRNVVDARPTSWWQTDLYNGWLGSLRELSKPTVAEEYPDCMRTEAWAMKTLNTQHASWSQLRHDTILYAKQSYSGAPLCYYPAGFVEPVPQFWSNMEGMLRRAVSAFETAPYPNVALKKRYVDFLKKFADTVKSLQGISVKELAQQELAGWETQFLENVIELGHVRFGSGRKIGFTGWYPALFFAGFEDSITWDALVADIHSNPPAPILGDPGCVVHQGVGAVDLMLMAVNNGKDRVVYAGPVMSHYEFEMPGLTRKSDSIWKDDLRQGRTPPRPVWTQSYLVPGKNLQRPNYEAPNGPIGR